MNSATGQTLRRLGLLIEAVSIFGILSVRRGNVGVWQRSGLDPSVVLTAAFVVGFVMWLAGTVLIRRSRDRY
jgi:hypothetical protein